MQPPRSFLNIFARLRTAIVSTKYCKDFSKFSTQMMFISLAKVLGKWSRAVDYLGSVQNSKLVKAKLSQMGDLHEYRSLPQGLTIKILDNRPESDSDSVPPASLLYDGLSLGCQRFPRTNDCRPIYNDEADKSGSSYFK